MAKVDALSVACPQCRSGTDTPCAFRAPTMEDAASGGAVHIERLDALMSHPERSDALKRLSDDEDGFEEAMDTVREWRRWQKKVGNSATLPSLMSVCATSFGSGQTLDTLSHKDLCSFIAVRVEERKRSLIYTLSTKLGLDETLKRLGDDT